MSKIFVSPAVITNEVDQSYLPAAVGSIGAAFVGTAPYGPAFVPYTAQTYSDASNVFGDLDEKHPMMYGVRAYMRNSAQATIVRVLGPAGRTVNGVAVQPGYTADAMWAITSVSGGVGYVHALLDITASSTLSVANLPNDLFDLRISGTNGYSLAVTGSLLSSSANYIGKLISTDASTYSTNGYYLHSVFDYATKLLNNGATTFGVAQTGLTGFQVGYLSASTPWVTSQEFGGNMDWNLFRFHSIGHGDAENGRLKVCISNVTPSNVPSVNPYGKFDVQVRAFTDTDRQPVVLESFPGCDLDPASINYLPRRIGDRFYWFDNSKGKMTPYGTYANVSTLVRVEMTTSAYPQQALPWGFRGFRKPLLSVSTGVSASNNGIQDLPYVQNILDKETQTEAKAYVFWGVEFQTSGSIRSRLNMFPSQGDADADFSLKWISGALEGNLRYVAGTANKKVPGSALTSTSLDSVHAQFALPLGGGFDGFDPRLPSPTANESQLVYVNQLGTQAVRQGIDCISDPEFIDINMLVIPGLWSKHITDYAVNTVESRGDAFYIADLSGSDVNTVVNNMQNLGYGSNYAAVYYPPVKVVDPVSNKIVTVPASVAAVGALAYTDKVSYPWFAPAGLNRGALNLDTIGFTVVEALDRLTQLERDKLYDVRINPIASFPSEGMAIWGQKTMQLKPSALDRVNVRRLLLYARKLVASQGKFLLFEPNGPATWTRFKQLVNPRLQDIQTKNGLQKFMVVMDETTNTPDLIDRNIMAGAIYLVPMRSTELLKVDFIVSRTGTTFSQ